MTGLDADARVPGEPPSVFISYRRDDVPDATDRLTGALRERFGSGQVFMDVDGIEIGADFEAVIGDWVRRCDVLLAVIGRDWLETRDEDGSRRIDDPGDYVRLEIEAALNRGIRVIPVLISGGRVPGPGELPSSLAPLSRRNAIELSRRHWELDVEELVNAIERFTGATPPQLPTPAPVKPADARPALLVRVGRRSRLLLAGVIVACVVAVVLALSLGSGSARVTLTTFSLPGPPEAIAFADGVLWDADANKLLRIDAQTGKTIGAQVAYTDKGAAFSAAIASGLAVGGGFGWVANSEGNAVTRVSERSGSPEGVPIAVPLPSAVALGDGSVWIAAGSASVLRLNASTGTQDGAPIHVGTLPDAIAVGAGGVWVANGGAASVTRIDPATGKVVGRAIHVPPIPQGIAVGDGFVWVTSELTGTVTRIDPRTNSVVGRPIDVGNGPSGIAVGIGSVWVANYNDDTVTRIDAATQRVLALHIYVGHAPQHVVAAGNAVWVANSQADSLTRIVLG